jgi:transposase-like protein
VSDPTKRRWSAQAKREVVLRLFAGESLEAVSRETGLPVHKLERFREKALTAMSAGLREREDDPVSELLEQAEAKIGQLTMELELYRGKAPRRTR